MTKRTTAMQRLGASPTRREFVGLAGAAALSVGGMTLLVGCGPAPRDAVAGTGPQGADAGAEEATLGDGEVLRVGMEAAYAPYNWQCPEESEFTIPIDNVAGAFADGYDVQVARRIADAFGVRAVAVKMGFDALVDALATGQVDIVCAGMSVTPKRAASADFSYSYLDDDISLVVRRDSPYAGATRLEDFAGASVIGQAATMYDDVIDQIPGVNHMTPAEAVPAVVENLANGTCDAITFSMMSVPHLLKTNPEFAEVPLEEGFEGSKMPDNAGVPKGRKAALDKVNEVIASIPEDERQALWDACMERQPA